MRPSSFDRRNRIFLSPTTLRLFACQSCCNVLFLEYLISRAVLLCRPEVHQKASPHRLHLQSLDATLAFSDCQGSWPGGVFFPPLGGRTPAGLVGDFTFKANRRKGAQEGFFPAMGRFGYRSFLIFGFPGSKITSAAGFFPRRAGSKALTDQKTTGLSQTSYRHQL